MWETALHSGPPGTAAGVLAPNVGNSPTFRSAWHRSGRAGARCGKQPYFAGRRVQQRARRRQVWETALLYGPPGTAAGAPAPGVGNSPTLRAAGHSSGRAGARCGKQPYIPDRLAPQRARRRQVWEAALLYGPQGAAADASAPGVGNSPTFQAAVRQPCEPALNHGQAGAAPDAPMQVWETALHGGQLATQLMRQRRIWETALLCGPQGDAADAPAPGVGNGSTLRVAGRSCGRSSAEYGKQPYFAGRRAPQRACRCWVWETALLFQQRLIRQDESKFKAIRLKSDIKLLFLMNIKYQLAARLSLIRYAQRGFIIYLP